MATPRQLAICCALASAVATRPAAAEHLPWLGVMADVGVPDGGSAAVVMRPMPQVRLHGGITHNLVSRGIRGGITYAPFRTTVGPTLTIDYGHYFDGDANPIVRTVTGDPMFSSPLLDRVGYDYANAHLGLELGRRWFTFYLHAGVSRVFSAVHGLDAALDPAQTGADPNTTITLSQDPGVAIWSVSAKLGFIFYFVK